MNWFIFFFLALIFILSPYSTGLYFTSSFFSLSLIIYPLFIMLFLKLIISKEIYQLKKVIFILLLPLCYLITLPIAENPSGAFGAVIVWFTFSCFVFLLYWVATSSKKIQDLLPIVFQFTGIWIGFFSLFLYFGWFTYQGAFVAERLASVFKYPNTFGMMMVAFFFYSIIMLTKEKNTYLFTIYYALPLVPFIVSFILSYSRGMFLVLPIVWIAGLLLMSVKKQLEYIVYTMITFVFSLLTYIAIVREVTTISIILAFICIALSVTTIFFVRHLLEKNSYFSKFQERKKYRIVVPAIVVIIALLTFLDFKYEGLLYKQIPAPLQERIGAIDITEGTAKERIVFVEDALVMFKDSPVIGHGAEGFRVLYRNYQQLPYQSNKIHNGYLEWLVDTGIVGLAFLVFVIFCFYRLLYQSYKNEADNTAQIAVITASFVIFIHTALDFNFSFGSVWLILFWLFMIGIVPHSKSKQKKIQAIQPQKNYLSIVSLSLFSILICVSFFFSYRFMLAEQYYQQSKGEKNLGLRQELIEQAVNFNPYNTTYLYVLGDSYAKQHRQGNEYAQKVEEIVNRLVGTEPNNSEVISQAGALKERIGELQEALDYYSYGLTIDKYNKSLFEKSIILNIGMATSLIAENKLYEANHHVSAAIKLYERNVTLYNQFLSKPLTNHEAFNSRQFKVTDTTIYYAALAYLIDGDYDKVLELSDELNGSTFGAEITALRILSLEAKEDYEQAKEIFDQNSQKYKHLHDLIEDIRSQISK